MVSVGFILPPSSSCGEFKAEFYRFQLANIKLEREKFRIYVVCAWTQELRVFDPFSYKWHASIEFNGTHWAFTDYGCILEFFVEEFHLEIKIGWQVKKDDSGTCYLVGGQGLSFQISYVSLRHPEIKILSHSKASEVKSKAKSWCKTTWVKQND